MTEDERTRESCKHLFNAMEPKILGVGYTARCIYCGKVSFIDLSKRAKNTEQPTIEEACRAALLDCVEAMETAQPYVESSGWTRHRDDEIAQIESAITNARKALE